MNIDELLEEFELAVSDLAIAKDQESGSLKSQSEIKVAEYKVSSARKALKFMFDHVKSAYQEDHDERIRLEERLKQCEALRKAKIWKS